MILKYCRSFLIADKKSQKSGEMDSRKMFDYQRKWERKVLPMVANNAPLEHIVGRMTRYFFTFYHRGGAEKHSLLHAAAISGRKDIVRAYFHRRSDLHVQNFVNARDNTGHTALMLAVKNEHVDVVRELVELGADVGARDREGHDIMWMAVERGAAGSMAVLEYLVDGDVDDFSSYFPYYSVHTFLYVAYLREGASSDLANAISLVNIGVPPETRLKFMNLILIAAAHNDKLEVVQYLVTCGVDVNHVTKQGLTALGIALSNNIQHPEVAAYLCGLSDRKVEMGNLDLSNHADVFVLLRKAVQLEKWQVVKYFVESGKDCNSNDGRTILQFALEERQLETVNYLINQTEITRDHNTFDLDSVDDMGHTVTMWAAKNGATSAVSYFLKSGADIARVDESGGTALSLAVEAGNVSTAEFLCRQPDIASCVTSAAVEGKLSTLEFALKEGFDINCSDRSGRTVLSSSVESGRVEVVLYLCNQVHLNVTVRNFGEFVELSNLIKCFEEDLSAIFARLIESSTDFKVDSDQKRVLRREKLYKTIISQLYLSKPHTQLERRNLLSLAEVAIPVKTKFGKSRRAMLREGLGENLYERFSAELANICQNEEEDEVLLEIARRMYNIYVRRVSLCSPNLY